MLERRRGGGERLLWLGAAAIALAALIGAAYVLRDLKRVRGSTDASRAVPPGPAQRESGKTASSILPAPKAVQRPSPTTSVPPIPVERKEEPPPKPPDPNVLFTEGFSAGAAPGPKWVPTRDGDFKEAVVDLVDGRLRLRAGTIGTRDDTVKHLGLRTAEPVVDVSSPLEIEVEIDWNSPVNGCYLQASLFLCPTATDRTAATERDWLKFEYVGVPPGKNARAALARRKAGQLRFLFTEGWPEQQRTGRPVGKQKVLLRLGPESIEVVENGRAWWGPSPHGLTFRRACLYLEMSSHSNYPPRELFFDNVTLRRVP